MSNPKGKVKGRREKDKGVWMVPMGYSYPTSLADILLVLREQRWLDGAEFGTVKE